MTNFHHHPDNFIFIRLKDYFYQDTLENFLLDCASLSFQYSGLPEKYIERFYDSEQGHFIATNNHKEPQSIPWKEGDDIILLVDAFLVAQTQRKLAEDTRTEEEKKQDVIENYCNNELNKTDKIMQICLEEDKMIDRLILVALNRTYTIAQENELLNYRRDLRLFIKNPNDLDNPIYPTKPNWL